ncbi:hypothetical protein BDU57DRAFT_498028 [Ampelomyces quisqualis]|uniref:Alcohol acetyltransferase n=1 Tax=Ampelomyces quisqualis TaxID=50730 RepID=A0A6A5QMA2_AMPQU|nr:hypothetical protein BDU57DRAFT_498028 [Ampelomyces quisqualis]
MATSRYPHLDWRESTKGHWERELDEVEGFYTQIAKTYEGTGRMAFAITGFLSFSVAASDSSSLSETHQLVQLALRSAWIRLRYSHPTIASHVEYDSVNQKWIKSYTACRPESPSDQLEEWLQATFIPITSSVSGLEWCNSDPIAPKCPSLFVITPPREDEDEVRTLRHNLVIRSPHDIIDGIGTLQLLNSLLFYAAEAFNQPETWVPPPPRSECQDLSPPLRVAAAIPPMLTLAQQVRLQSIITRNFSLREGVQVLTLPLKRGSLLPGKHQRIAHEATAVDTARILEACKFLNATVTHVYHAAVAISLRDMQESGQDSRQVRYISYALLNKRSKCAGEYRTSKHAATVYHSVSGDNLSLDLVIPSAAEKITNDQEQPCVKEVGDFYRAQGSPDDLVLAPLFMSMATPHIENPTLAPHEVPIPDPNMSPSVSLSSIGVIDKIIKPQHGPFRVDKPWVTGEELGTGLGVFLGTWNGKLQLSAAYNDAWHIKEEVDAYLNLCQKVVRKGLGLDD